MKELLGTPVHDGCIAETNCRCFGHRSTVTRIYVFRGVRSSYRLSRAILRATIVPIETRITRTTCTHTHADGPPSSCTRAQVPSVVKLMEVGFSSDTLSLTSAILGTRRPTDLIRWRDRPASFPQRCRWNEINEIESEGRTTRFFCFVLFISGREWGDQMAEEMLHTWSNFWIRLSLFGNWGNNDPTTNLNASRLDKFISVTLPCSFLY